MARMMVEHPANNYETPHEGRKDAQPFSTFLRWGFKFFIRMTKKEIEQEKKRTYMVVYNQRDYVIEKKRIYSKEWEKTRKRKPRPGRKQKRSYKRNPILDHSIHRIGITDSYVYFIQVKNTIIYKIGITNNPLKRVEVLQTGCPFDLELKMCFITANAVEVERRIHRDLNQFRRRGEWFNISHDHLERIKTELQ